MEWRCWVGRDGTVADATAIFLGDASASAASAYARDFERYRRESGSHQARDRTECINERHAIWATLQTWSGGSDWSPTGTAAAGDETGEYIPTGNACRFDGGYLPDRVSVSLRSNNEARRIVEMIVAAQALAPNFRVLSSTHPDVRNNAIATIDRNGNRIIAYDPNFMTDIERQTGSNWAAASVFAHEVGHHLNGHTLVPGGSRPPTELEADYFSGFIMKALGASLNDAQAAMRLIASERGSASHPARRSRLVAIERGWQQGTAPNPGGGVAIPPVGGGTRPGPGGGTWPGPDGGAWPGPGGW